MTFVTWREGDLNVGGGGEGLSAGSFSQSAAGNRALSNLKPGFFLVITNKNLSVANQMIK